MKFKENDLVIFNHKNGARNINRIGIFGEYQENGLMVFKANISIEFGEALIELCRSEGFTEYNYDLLDKKDINKALEMYYRKDAKKCKSFKRFINMLKFSME